MYGKFVERYKRQLLITVTIAIAIAGILNIYQAFFINVTSNDECIWAIKKDSEKGFGIFFSNVKEGGVTDKAGIKNGDMFLEINGETVISPFQAQDILNKLNYGDYVEYTVKRDGEIFKTKVFVKKLYNMRLIAFSFFFFVWLVLGFLTLITKLDGEVQWLFYLIGAFGVLSLVRESFFPMMILIPEPVIPVWAVLSFLYVQILLYVFYLHFFLLFPIRSKLLKFKYLIQLIYGLAFIFAGFMTYNLLRFMNSGGKEPLLLNPDFVLTAIFLFTQVFGVISLILSYLRIKERKMKVPLMIIIVAYIIGISSLFFVSVIANALGLVIYNDPEYFIPVLSIILLPLAFAVAIFKYQLLDVSVVIKNTIFYGTATVSLAAVYLLSVYGLGQSIGAAFGEDYRNIIAAITFVLFALIFQSTKDRFQELITQRFYPEQYYQQQVLSKLTDELSNFVGKANIIAAIQETFIDKIKVERFGIFLKEEDGAFSTASLKGFEDHNFKINSPVNFFESFIFESYTSNKQRVFNHESFDKVFPFDFEKLKEERIFTVIPLIVKRELKGFIALGLKYSGSMFTGKDLELLNFVGAQSAISLENARLYEAEAEKVQFDRDLVLARSIQQDLLPKVFPESEMIQFAGSMIPAKMIGGDYFDVIKLDDFKYYVAIGDVSGKGLSAALYMTKLQTILKLYCSKRREPSDILKELNYNLCDNMGSGWFITL
ncbi:MAG: SpoIIE family protein phosphatase, partial [Ignavibacteriaceae bacterium]|nr:SpoIIE family protein phosphatase [Ignavibacteriaceae bacterium]